MQYIFNKRHCVSIDKKHVYPIEIQCHIYSIYIIHQKDNTNGYTTEIQYNNIIYMI